MTDKQVKYNYIELRQSDGSTKKVSITKRIGVFKLKDLREIKKQLGFSLNKLIEELGDDNGDISALLDLIYFLSSLSQLGVSYSQYLDFIEEKDLNYLNKFLEDTSSILDGKHIQEVMGSQP